MALIRALLPGIVFALLALSSAFGQIRWVKDLDAGLTEARERNAPIFCLVWDYN
jgi:hypothetical protein